MHILPLAFTAQRSLYKLNALKVLVYFLIDKQRDPSCYQSTLIDNIYQNISFALNTMLNVTHVKLGIFESLVLALNPSIPVTFNQGGIKYFASWQRAVFINNFG